MPTGEPAAPREANTARAIWALTAGTFALALNLNVLAPLLPDIGRSFEASPETLGLLSAVYAVPQALGAPLLGPLADRWGRRPLMLAALVGFTLAGLAAAAAPGLVWLALARAIAGLSSSVFVPAAYAWIGDQVPLERRAAGISNVTMAGPLASLVILPLSAFLDVQFGWRSPFLVLAALSLFSFWPISKLPDSHARRRGGPGVLGTYRAMLAAPGAPGLLLASLCYALSGIGPTAFLAVYLVEAHGLSVAASGLALGALSAVRVLGNRASARFADRQGHQRAVLAGLGGIALGYVVLAIPGVPLPLALFGVALTGFAFQAGYPAQVTLVTNLVPEARGTAASANTGLFYLGAALGPILTGAVVGSVGPSGVGWVGLAGALAGVLAAMAAGMRLPGREARRGQT